jgi:hypothetical protein
MVDFRALMNIVYMEASAYTTVRQTDIHNWKMALLFRSFQLALFGYIVCWDILYKKGYQFRDVASSAVTTKVKGLGFTRSMAAHDDSARITTFDTADYVVPPSEYNSVELKIV